MRTKIIVLTAQPVEINKLRSYEHSKHNQRSYKFREPCVCGVLAAAAMWTKVKVSRIAVLWTQVSSYRAFACIVTKIKFNVTIMKLCKPVIITGQVQVSEVTASPTTWTQCLDKLSPWSTVIATFSSRKAQVTKYPFEKGKIGNLNGKTSHRIR